MSKISEMVKSDSIDGSEILPIIDDGVNKNIDILTMMDDISLTREDFVYSNGMDYLVPNFYSMFFDVFHSVGGIEEPVVLDTESEPSTLIVPHAIIENPATGWKKTLLKGHLLHVPRELEDFHLYETRFRVLKGGENPSGTIYFGGMTIADATGIGAAYNPFVGFLISIPSSDQPNILSGDISIQAYILDNDSPTSTVLLNQVLTTPASFFAESLPLTDSEYIKLGVKLFKNKVEFYINDALMYTYTVIGSLFSVAYQPVNPCFAAYSFTEDFDGGGSLYYYIDYISTKSRISR